MPMKTTYQIGDDGDELQVSMFLGEFQVCGAIIPLLMLTPDEAYELAHALGEEFIQQNNKNVLTETNYDDTIKPSDKTRG